MKFHIHKALAIAAAAAILVPVAAAFAAPVAVPNPALPAIPPNVQALLPITLTGTGTDCKGKAPTAANPNDTCTLSDLLPPTVLPEPDAILAMLQGQVQLIAAALGQQPADLLSRVLGESVPSVNGVVLTVNELLNRLIGTKVFDATSNGILGTTEISVGNVSHAFDMTVPVVATDIDCLPGQSDTACKAANNNPRRLELPGYEVNQSNWVPEEPVLIPATTLLGFEIVPANAIIGTSIAVPLVQGLGAVGLALAPGLALPAPLPITGLTTTNAAGETKPSLAFAQVCTADPASRVLPRPAQPDQGQPGDHEHR